MFKTATVKTVNTLFELWAVILLAALRGTGVAALTLPLDAFLPDDLWLAALRLAVLRWAALNSKFINHLSKCKYFF